MYKVEFCGFQTLRWNTWKGEWKIIGSRRKENRNLRSVMYTVRDVKISQRNDGTIAKPCHQMITKNHKVIARW